jgi:acetolactate synthase I/III small subunit
LGKMKKTGHVATEHQARLVEAIPPMTCAIPIPSEETHTLAVIVDNEPGVLARVIGLFSGRGYNIESLTVAETDHPGHRAHHHRDHRHAAGDRADQGAAWPDGAGARGPRPDGRGAAVERELALLKVAGKGEARIEALRLAEIFRANVVDSTLESFVFEITGAPEKIDAFAELMRPLGLREIARTGVAALARG